MKNFDEIKVQKSFPELMLEKTINSVIKIKSEKSNPMLSPSSLNCLRAAAFKLSGAEVEESEETYESHLAAEVGSFIHARTQKFLQESDIWVDVEKYIKEHPELNIRISEEQKSVGEITLEFTGIRNGVEVPPFRFQCDGIVLIDNVYYIVEIKTKSEAALSKIDAPLLEHSKQAVGYAFLYEIPNILWVYASRDSFGSNRKIFLEEVTPQRVVEFIDLCKQIYRAVKNNDIKSLPGQKNCRYCAFIKQCKAL